MATKRILILDGHPDPAKQRYLRALIDAYSDGAKKAGHEVRTVRIAELSFPLLRTAADFETGQPPAAIATAQADLQWCTHLAVFYPLWLGSMPALLKAFFEQALRPGFAFSYRPKGLPEKLMRGRSVRVVVTMGMPSLFYRWFYRAHSLKSLERNILKFTGFAPVRTSVIGGIGANSERGRARWLDKLRQLGKRGI